MPKKLLLPTEIAQAVVGQTITGFVRSERAVALSFADGSFLELSGSKVIDLTFYPKGTVLFKVNPKPEPQKEG